MKFLTPCLALLLVFMVGGCSAEITGTVVDSETGKPIEGAVVLVECTITKGLPGMIRTESYKIVEIISDKDGKVGIPKIYNPLANKPEITVYKKGYVVWNSEYMFPDYKKRGGLKKTDNYLFKMEKFIPEYKFQEHVSFIHNAIGLGRGEKSLMMKAIEWEETKAFEERGNNRK